MQQAPQQAVITVVSPALSKAAKAVYKQRVSKIRSKDALQLNEACDEQLDDDFMGPGGGADALLKVVLGKVCLMPYVIVLQRTE